MKYRRQLLRVVLLALPACVYLPTESSPYASAEEDLNPGQTSREQIVKEFGVPNVGFEGYRYMVYEWTSEGVYVTHPISLLACAPPVGPMEGVKSHYLLLEFSSEGLLIRSALERRSWTEATYDGLSRDVFFESLISNWTGVELHDGV